MAGFRNESLNVSFKQGFFNSILYALLGGCKLMLEDCINSEITIPNHEEKIRTYLLENYLESEEVRETIGLSGFPVRFLPEIPENYDEKTNTYIGRTDIRVLSENWLYNRNDYYIVECKRLDGTAVLYQKYVDEGICRFIGENPKYLSYNNRNIMLGFLVKNIQIPTFIENLRDIHMDKIKKLIKKNFIVLESTKEYSICESAYINKLYLNHIVYNISGAVL